MPIVKLGWPNIPERKICIKEKKKSKIKRNIIVSKWEIKKT